MANIISMVAPSFILDSYDLGPYTVTRNAVSYEDIASKVTTHDGYTPIFSLTTNQNYLVYGIGTRNNYANIWFTIKNESQEPINYTIHLDILWVKGA